MAFVGQPVVGASELDEADREDLKQVQDLLMTLRRKTVSLVQLPSIGGASGADFAKIQLEKVWETMRLGHKFGRKKGDVRAFVLSVDLFSPNVAKHGVATSMSTPIAVDTERMKRVIDFILQKRLKDDIVLLFDGRSKAGRRVLEQYEDRLGAVGAHVVNECWFVYALPQKNQDPRVPGKQTCFANNNREVAISSLAAKKSVRKIVQRAEFNSCGEISTASTTYTGVPVRRYSELPRMDYETKSAILGIPAAGATPRKRVQKDIDQRGHPFSHCEVKPLNLWQRVMEHHDVTHIVDFSPGSGALAIAAAGAMEYEGVTGNDAHQDWLNSTLDRCVMYMATKDKNFTKQLGGDDAFLDKVIKYFAGTVMEARRMLEPVEGDEAQDDDQSSEEEAE